MQALGALVDVQAGAVEGSPVAAAAGQYQLADEGSVGVDASMRTLRTVVPAQQALVHVLTALRRRAEVPAGTAKGRAIVTPWSIPALLVIPTPRTDRALVYVHAVARIRVSLVSQATRFGGPVTIRALYPVVARTSERSSCYVASRRLDSAGSSPRSANVGAVRINAILSRAVARMQTEQTFVNIFATFLGPARIPRSVTQPETRWTDWRTSVATLRVHATLACAASRFSIGALVDINATARFSIENIADVAVLDFVHDRRNARSL